MILQSVEPSEVEPYVATEPTFKYKKIQTVLSETPTMKSPTKITLKRYHLAKIEAKVHFRDTTTSLRLNLPLCSNISIRDLKSSLVPAPSMRALSFCMVSTRLPL